MSAASRGADLLRRGVRPADLTAARISRRLNAGPRYGVELPRSGGLFCFAQCTTKAAPIAVPASCGAEGRNTFEKLPDCRTSSLVTQLSATPPARHNLSSGTLRLRRRTRAMTAAFVASCSAAATSAWRGRIWESMYRGGPNKASNLANLFELEPRNSGDTA